MWKRISLLLMVALTVVVLDIVGQVISTADDKTALVMSAASRGDYQYSKESENPIDITFKNNSDTPLKILDVFDNPQLTRMFVGILLRDESGTPVGPFGGGGKVSFSRDQMKYVELQKGEEFTFRINMRDFFPKNYTLKSGHYDITVSYRNQYGDGVKGRLESKKFGLLID